MNYVIQGSNNPILIEFDDITPVCTLFVSLWTDTEKIKEWNPDELTNEGNVVALPLNQEETLAFPIGNAYLEIKWLEDDDTYFATKVKMKVLER